MIGLLLVVLGATPRPYDPAQIGRMNELAVALRSHVAALDVGIAKEKDQPLLEEAREGYAVVWGPTTLACLSFLVEDATTIDVVGPRGKLAAKVTLYDVERRVALLETQKPLATIGLVPAEKAPAASRGRDEILFALVGTNVEDNVISGVIVDDGSAAELEKHPRISLQLALGMPVFDPLVRFVGYARAVSWDKDRGMIVTADHVLAAKTATTAALPARPAASPRPWWAR